MYKKICPTCRQKSFSSCPDYQWDCPVCTTDLSLQKSIFSAGSKRKGEYPTKKKLSIFIKGREINKQI